MSTNGGPAPQADVPESVNPAELANELVGATLERSWNTTGGDKRPAAATAAVANVVPLPGVGH